MIYRYVKEPGTKSKIISLLLILATVLIHGVIRFASSTISSVLVYHATLAAGIAYQATYVPATCAALVIFLYVLLPALLAINNQYPTTYLQEDKKEKDKEQITE